MSTLPPRRIGIQDPGAPRGTKIGYVDITGGSVTTAGTYERSFEQGGKRYFHILDARTGCPAWNSLATVAIVAADSKSEFAVTHGLRSHFTLTDSSFTVLK